MPSTFFFCVYVRRVSYINIYVILAKFRLKCSIMTFAFKFTRRFCHAVLSLFWLSFCLYLSLSHICFPLTPPNLPSVSLCFSILLSLSFALTVPIAASIWPLYRRLSPFHPLLFITRRDHLSPTQHCKLRNSHSN